MTASGRKETSHRSFRFACTHKCCMRDKSYWLYLLECEGGVYYAGIALDVAHRFLQHACGAGAKFTRARPPLRVLAAREYGSKGDALRAELELKKLRRDRKLTFFEGCERAC